MVRQRQGEGIDEIGNERIRSVSRLLFTTTLSFSTATGLKLEFFRIIGGRLQVLSVLRSGAVSPSLKSVGLCSLGWKQSVSSEIQYQVSFFFNPS